MEPVKKGYDQFQKLIDSQADFIIDTQLPSGVIPWYRGGIADPWDHIECAIALDLAGRHREAAAAYLWSKNTQNPDGSWFSSYEDYFPDEMERDTNFASYIATGMWFNYLSTGDKTFLGEMWPVIEKALDFAISLQQPTGEIAWALSETGDVWPGAVLTSACSTWHSIENGIKIAEVLGHDASRWRQAAGRLLSAIRNHPELFDKMGENSRRYAMHWFYPILAGVMSGQEARERIHREWDDFIIEGWGCRVAADDENVTAVAETSELIIALCLIGEKERANRLMEWTLKLKDDTPGFCRGIKMPEQIPFPPERATWTSAALIMAVAALAKE